MVVFVHTMSGSSVLSSVTPMILFSMVASVATGAVAVAIAVAVGAAVKGAAVAVTIIAVIFGTTDFVGSKVIGVVVKAHRDGVVRIRSAARPVIRAAVVPCPSADGGIPLPPIAVRRGPQAVALAVAVRHIAVAVGGHIVVILARAIHLTQVLTVIHLVAGVAGVV